MVWQEILGSNHLFEIYSPFVDLKVHDSLRAGMRLHMKEGVKGMIYILKPESYKLELLRELVI